MGDTTLRDVHGAVDSFAAEVSLQLGGCLALMVLLVGVVLGGLLLSIELDEEPLALGGSSRSTKTSSNSSLELDLS